MARNPDGTWDTPTWVLARTYGLQEAFDLFGTTGYFDEDMKRMYPVEIIPQQQQKIIRAFVPVPHKSAFANRGIE